MGDNLGQFLLGVHLFCSPKSASHQVGLIGRDNKETKKVSFYRGRWWRGNGRQGGKTACPSRRASSDASLGQAEIHQVLQNASRLHLEPILLFVETQQPRPLAVSSLSLASAHSDIQKVREGRADTPAAF